MDMGFKFKKSGRKPHIRSGGRIFEWKIFAGLRYVIVAFLAWFLKLWWWTLRVKVSEDGLRVVRDTPSPVVFIHWHNHLFFSGYWGKMRPKGRLYALISAGAIGAWISPFFKHFNAKAIRGSTNLRGKEVLREFIEVLEERNDVIVTPDGSRGPCYSFKPGTALAVKSVNPAIVFFSCNFHNAWRLKTWDRFYIPKPFSRVDCVFKKIDSYKELTESDDVGDIQEALRAELMGITYETET